MSNLIIVGAGGFGLEVAAYARDIAAGELGDALTLIGFLDDVKKTGEIIAGIPILGTTDKAAGEGSLFIIAVGAPDGRARLADKLAQQGCCFAGLRHPFAYVAQSAKLGEGVIVAPFAFVGAEATVADHCLLNIHSCVGHEAKIGACAVLSPYADVNGAAIVESCAFLGAHACVMPRLRIGQHSKIAAGAVVYNDIPAGATALGNPAACRIATSRANLT